MIYETAAEKAVELLRQGKMPMFESRRQPVGALSGEAYQGVNGTLLCMDPRNDKDPRWILRDQADRQNLFIKKDEKATKVIKQSWTKSVARIDPETGYPERDSRGNVQTQTVRLQNPTMRLVPAFNASQMQDVPPLGQTIHPWDPVQRGEEILKNSGITVKYDQKEREHYNPRMHEIHMKPESAYENREQFVEAGLYQMARAMAHESAIRTRNVGDEGKEMRDQFAVARAHAVLCSNIGIRANADRQLEHAQEFIDTLEKNPYTIMEASKLASEIVNEVQTREMKRDPERLAEVKAERQAMVFASPKVEIENLRSMQRVLTDVRNNPDNVFTFQHEGEELFARKGEERLYSRPSDSPGVGDVFDLKHQITAFNRNGEMFNVIMTSSFIQGEDGRSEPLGNNRRSEITDLNRSSMFPPDWTGELSVQNGMYYQDRMIVGGIPDDEAEFVAVCAIRSNGHEYAVKAFDSRENAEEFAAIYENELDRQTGQYKEKSLEGVTFFDVKFDEGEKKAAQALGLEYYGQVKSWGAPPDVDLGPVHNRFDEHDPYRRMAEIEARKAERAAGVGVTIIDVPAGREEEAQFLGARESRKYGHFYIPDNVNPEPLLERFEQRPAVVKETPARQSYTIPYPERGEAAEKGIVYNAGAREYEADREVDREALDRWDSENHGSEMSMLTPTREAALVIESVGLDLASQEPQLIGVAVQIDVADDIPNQKNGTYIAYQDGSCYAKNNLTQEEVVHPAKGYVLTDEVRQHMREEVRTLLSTHERAAQEKLDKAAAKLRETFENMTPAAEQNQYMKDNGIQPMEGVFTKGKNVIIPLVNAGGEIRSSLTIKPDGSETYAQRSQIVGSFAAMGGYDKLKDSPAILVTMRPEEGAVVSQATGWGVAAVTEENNFKAVIRGLQAEMPNKPVLALVNDKLEKAARDISAATSAAILTPTFAQGERDQGLSSFKDMAQSSRLGIEGVEKQVKAGVEKEISKARDVNNKEQAKEQKKGRNQELSIA
ncbi:MAG: ssDNA-binding domain-containing protein [Planctomycetota bacterium]|nr:ssDNA-binding domain-containing protein [Planctomycetota bacterium]